MKAIAYMSLLAVGLAMVPSCANYANFNRVSANSVGTVQQVIPGTVVSARTVRIDASSTDKQLGTGVGAVAGAASGALLGGGKGQLVSAAGFGLAGALAGRAIGKYANQSDGQELTIQADKGKQMYTVTQPIYEGYGAIPVGTHGNLQYGSNARFVPDGMGVSY